MVAVESSASNAMHSEMDRRGGIGAWITATGSLPLSITTSAPARTPVRAFQDPLKSHYSNRDVPLTVRARQILEQISKDCYTETLFPIPKSTLQHQMQRTCRKLKLEGLSLHSFRHTFGTRLGEAGASAHVIKQLMGHSSITVSQRYVHKLTESVERAMAAMEEANHRNN